jgi:protein-glucosylgalactosylhydroxylysine glucosidase
MVKGITALLFLTGIMLLPAQRKSDPIDRLSLVSRHNVHNNSLDSLSVLSVGNGSFTFTADLTGLQTFPDFYSKGIALGTMSEWGWHSAPNPENFSLSDVYKQYIVHGREVDYVHQFRAGEGERKIAATNWLRANPHRIHLGMIGLYLVSKDGKEARIGDIRIHDQVLDLWTGAIESNFSFDGERVRVITICHPDKDMVSARVESNLIRDGRLKVRIHFPLGIPDPLGYDFSSPDKHSTAVIAETFDETVFERKQDEDKYYVRFLHKGCSLKKSSEHLFTVKPVSETAALEVSCRFSKSIDNVEPDDFISVREASRLDWEKYWMSSGMVDFSGCSDPRAPELERRVILSQYLTRIQCRGSYPPAETGLTYNSWFGKFHLEMHWWHAVHFALWNNTHVLEKQMNYYSVIMANAINTASHQGYKGARWPKMTDDNGRESPSNVGTYLIWQQPHPIFYAELLYVNSKNKKEILQKYSDIVFRTAEFMASYAWPDSITGRYTLGPVLIAAQESLNRETTINPAFETVYWYWGLKTANEWRKRLGLKPDPLWADIVAKISPLAVSNGLYLCSRDTKDSYSNPRLLSDHPIVSGILGVLPPTKLVDRKILSNSLDTIVKKWNWKSTWGWDFPMLAMSAGAIGRGEEAVDFLLMDTQKNSYLTNGHNYQDARLSVYLPGNGGLLTAVARMCVGNEFPHNGKWNVKWENLGNYVK